MKYDCVIIGGGPAGLNAALVLGRAKRSVALLDSGRPRNGVTHASHGYLTRDGIEPGEFRRIAYEEVLSYPSVLRRQDEAIDVRRTDAGFAVHTAGGERLEARKLIVAAGLKETLPEIDGLRDLYGKSIFNCPFCDGWELRDRPLALLADQPGAFHKVKLLVNWSRDLIVCTNGRDVLSDEQREELAARDIRVVATPIAALIGRGGLLERVRFADGASIERSGGFVDPVQTPYVQFEAALGYRVARHGGIDTDVMGRTTVPGVFAAGDSAYVMPSQLIYAAASGSRAAMAVMAELTEEDWRLG